MMESWLRGSSPRAWGLRSATAGPSRRIAVHPHVRGDYLQCSCFQNCTHRFIPTCVGITGAAGRPARHLKRFIPTCVGITLKTCRILGSTSVHPHVRGDYDSAEPPNTAPKRFIPTCVGITVSLAVSLAFIAVHPHVRGDYDLRHRLAHLVERFIPTCVGITNY